VATHGWSRAWVGCPPAKECPDVPDASPGVERGPLHITYWDTRPSWCGSAKWPWGRLMILGSSCIRPRSPRAESPTPGRGRYHGEGCRPAGERLGLDVDKAPGLGRARTSTT
jgi:hypothetical protein